MIPEMWGRLFKSRWWTTPRNGAPIIALEDAGKNWQEKEDKGRICSMDMAEVHFSQPSAARQQSDIVLAEKQLLSSCSRNVEKRVSVSLFFDTMNKDRSWKFSVFDVDLLRISEVCCFWKLWAHDDLHRLKILLQELEIEEFDPRLHFRPDRLSFATKSQ